MNNPVYMVTKFVKVRPNTCVSSAWNVLCVTPLVPRILR